MATVCANNGSGSCATTPSASIGPQVGNSDFIAFRGLTITGSTINNCSKNIQFLDSAATADITFTNNGFGCTGTDLAVIDNVTFINVGPSGAGQGRLQFVDIDTATVTNSLFQGQGASPSDGIQLTGNARRITIGPDNIFDGITDIAACHCDAIQDFGGGTGNIIEKNLFMAGDTFVMMPDGSTNVTVRDNVFDGSAVSYIDKIQFGSASNPVFSHNTLCNVRASFDSKVGESATSGALAENNILTCGSSYKTSGGNGCTSCTFRYNLFNVSGNASGTNTTIATPTFIGGGASPATWAGWELANGSSGENAGNDGLDLGTTYYGTPAAGPSAPTNFRLVQEYFNGLP